MRAGCDVSAEREAGAGRKKDGLGFISTRLGTGGKRGTLRGSSSIRIGVGDNVNYLRPPLTEVKLWFFASESWEQGPMSLVLSFFQQTSGGSFRTAMSSEKCHSSKMGSGSCQGTEGLAEPVYRCSSVSPYFHQPDFRKRKCVPGIGDSKLSAPAIISLENGETFWLKTLYAFSGRAPPRQQPYSVQSSRAASAVPGFGLRSRKPAPAHTPPYHSSGGAHPTL